MANKEQKRGAKEARKPKKAKAKAVAPSAFVVTPGKSPAGKKK